MTNEKLLEYRLKLIHESIRMVVKPDRVPHFSNVFTWMVLDSGYSLKESAYDYEILDKIILSFSKKYIFDCMPETGSRIIPRIVDPIGGLSNHVDYEREFHNVIERELIKSDEYDAYMENPDKFEWEIMLPRKYPKFGKGMQVSDLKTAVTEMLVFFERSTKLANRIEEETGQVVLKFGPDAAGLLPTTPIEDLASYFRGIKGIARDLHQQPEKVKEYCEFQFERTGKPALEMLRNGPQGSNKNIPFDLFITMLQHNQLSKKQWDKYYWPYFKKSVDTAIEAGKTVFVLAEGSIGRFYEYFSEFKKGHLAILLEQDDIFEARKAMPNVCLIGGMKTSLLGSGTKEECVASAKHLIDELGREGGFILSQDKMMIARGDCKAENLKAICDFAQSYQA